MANSSFTKVFTTESSNTNSTVITWPGGTGQMVVAGTFGSGTVKLQLSPDDGTTWVDVGGDSSVTAAAVVNYSVNACSLRLNLSGSSGASINAWLTQSSRDDVEGKGVMDCPY